VTIAVGVVGTIAVGVLGVLIDAEVPTNKLFEDFSSPPR
jgi:hypothetical protein